MKYFDLTGKNWKLYSMYMKYWCNNTGDLFTPYWRNTDTQWISEKELPPQLQYAYKNLWGEDYGAWCYLVETPKGYGVALEYEYYEDDADVSHSKLVDMAKSDAKTIKKNLKNKGLLDLYLLESNPDNMRTSDAVVRLFVIFDANMHPEEFTSAVQLLDSLSYKSLRQFEEHQNTLHETSKKIKVIVSDKSIKDKGSVL